MYRSRFDDAVRYRDAVRRRDRVRAQLQEAQHELAQQQSALHTAVLAHRRESADVERLETGVVLPAVLRLLGRAESRLATEREEARQAAAALDLARAAVRGTEARIELLQRQLDAFADVDAQYDRVFRAKATALLDRNDDSAHALRRHIAALEYATAQLRDIEEALHAAEQTLQHLRAVQALVDSWMIGLNAAELKLALQGILVPDSMRKLKRALPLAQAWLDHLARELSDLEGFTHLCKAIAADASVAAALIQAVYHRGPGSPRLRLHRAQQRVRAAVTGVRQLHPAARERYLEALAVYRTAVERG